MKRFFALLILLTVSVAASAIFRSKSSSNALSIPEASSAPAPASAERGPVRMIRFVLSDDGIYPRQLRVGQGLFNISIEDKTKKSEGVLIDSVTNEGRLQISKISRHEKQWRGRGLVRLTPGRYLISDASQPQREAEVVVDP